MLLPRPWSAALRGGAAAALRPGQQAAGILRKHGEDALAAVHRHFDTASQLAAADKEIAALRLENRRLAAELEERGAQSPFSGLPGRRAAVAGEGPGVRADPAPDPLLLPRAVRARVLGAQARLFLARRGLLDVGSREGVETHALVVEPSPAVIDRGADAQLAPGRLVLDGARVWGRVVEVGPRTSTVRRATEAGYRDVVRLAAGREDASPLRLGPEGLLEGTGETLARVRRVPVSEPVELGDLVVTAGGEGVLERPLLYGHVVRVERPAGAAHWDIWMEPAVPPRGPEQVAVLTIEWNPLRMAQKDQVLQREAERRIP